MREPGIRWSKLTRDLVFVALAVGFVLARPTPAHADIQCSGANMCYYSDPSMNYTFQCGFALAAGIGGCCGAGSGSALCVPYSPDAFSQTMYVACDSDIGCTCDIYGDYCDPSAGGGFGPPPV